MFTGIVEEMGTLKAIRKGPHSAVLEIQAKVVLEDIHLGDSIAVNGVCLTATSYSPTGFTPVQYYRNNYSIFPFQIK